MKLVVGRLSHEAINHLAYGSSKYQYNLQKNIELEG